jgi:UDP-N-acetylglucosamine/UDP-N-acetylgalactosamine diphosphorylase
MANAIDLPGLRQKVQAARQEKTLRFFDALDSAGQAKLAGQLDALDWQAIGKLIEQYVRYKPTFPIPTNIEPVKAFPRAADASRQQQYAQAEQLGKSLLAQGKIAAFLVAGGQGTRLGYDGPKGEYPVTPIKRHPLFQVFAEQLLAHGRDHGRAIPWYIMTSEANDAATRAFFAKNKSFGLDPANIYFFTQGMMPAFAPDGELLLAEKDSLALSPDGHGGSLRALYRSGALADMRRRGIEHLSYFQVDNPLVHAIDPLFLGLHASTGSEMPDALANQKNPDGSLRFNEGSIAIHALAVSFIERLTAGSLQLPWHRAEKKVPYVDDAGKMVKPEKPNAVKLEQFVFDAIPLARNAMVYMTDRAEEFSPVKNADGSDSPATCRRDQIRRAARWLGEAGVSVPTKDGEPDAVIEISSLYATSAGQLRQKLSTTNVSIAAGSSKYLGKE